tara:strand:- start:192 stop:617 length:426 start_codon:yes stop_codon:yes gene_type:complete
LKRNSTIVERFSRTIDRWLDQGHGNCKLAQPSASRIVADALHHFDGKRYLIHSSVIMPNHVHILVSLSVNEDLAKVVASWKSFTSRQINGELGRDDPLWQKDYFDRLIRDKDHFGNVVRYIGKHTSQSSSAILYQTPWLLE